MRYKPSIYVQEILDEALADAEEKGVETPGEDAGWVELLIWLDAYTETPETASHIVKFWEEEAPAAGFDLGKAVGAEGSEAPTLPEPFRRPFARMYHQGLVSAAAVGGE